VVDQDQDDVRRTLGCLYRLRELPRVGVGICPPYIAGEVEVGPRQDARCRRIGGLLCQGRHRAQAERDACEESACQGVADCHCAPPVDLLNLRHFIRWQEPALERRLPASRTADGAAVGGRGPLQIAETNAVFHAAWRCARSRNARPTSIAPNTMEYAAI